MANVLIPFPGRRVRDVEQMVAGPAEQVLAQIAGVEHVMSVSRPGLAVHHGAVQGRRAAHRGAGAPVRHRQLERRLAAQGPGRAGADHQAQGHRRRADRHADAVQQERRRPAPTTWSASRTASKPTSSACAGTREVDDDRRPGPRACWSRSTRRAWPAPASPSPTCAARCSRPTSACRSASCSPATARWRSRPGRSWPMPREVGDAGGRRARRQAGLPAGRGRRARRPAAGAALRLARQRGQGRRRGAEYPAVTIAVTKKPGENAIDVADAVMRRVDALRNTVIPADVAGGRDAQLRRDRQRQGA